MKFSVMKMSAVVLALLTAAGLAACGGGADTKTDVTGGQQYGNIGTAGNGRTAFSLSGADRSERI